ncbi:MAG TPA: hypothetical protein VHX68_03260, partial [Planctomycetaceae bacterium]|nr:hypothetical protein [Planctomycetaceae bacterium]
MPCRRTRPAPTKPITSRNPHRQTPTSHTTTIDELCRAVQPQAALSKSAQLIGETATGTGADEKERAADRGDEAGAIGNAFEVTGNAPAPVRANHPGGLVATVSRPEFALASVLGSVPSLKMA